MCKLTAEKVYSRGASIAAIRFLYFVVSKQNSSTVIAIVSLDDRVRTELFVDKYQALTADLQLNLP